MCIVYIIFTFSGINQKNIKIDIEDMNKHKFLHFILHTLSIEELNNLVSIFCYQKDIKSYIDILYFIKQSDFGMFYFDKSDNQDLDTVEHNDLRNKIIHHKKIICK